MIWLTAARCDSIKKPQAMTCGAGYMGSF